MTNQTFVGNVTGEPEFRQNQDSRVANFTIAVSSRALDKNTNQWVDEGAGFIRCAAWNGLADAVMANLHKGTPVVVEGPLKFRDWTSKDGQKSGTAMELTVQELGFNLRFHDVQPMKRTGQGGGGGAAASHYGQPAQSAASAYGQQPQQEPWGQQTAASSPPAAAWQQQQPPAQAAPPAQQQQAWGNAQAQNGWANPGANFDDTEAPF